MKKDDKINSNIIELEKEFDINYLFNEMSLYTKKKFNICQINNGTVELNNEVAGKFSNYIGLDKKRLISTCKECGRKEFPFTIEYSFLDKRGKSSSEGILFIDDNDKTYINLKQMIIWGQLSVEKLADYKSLYIIYKFTCTNNSDHVYLMIILLEFKNGIINVTKVGNYPSNLEIKGFDFQIHKRFLDEIDAYEDYKKAEMTFANGYYIGSFIYLRRIFEKMVNHYLLSFPAIKENTKMEDKIKKIKGKFDIRINQYLGMLYSILSLGVHQLTEEECEEYYNYLKAIIDMQLLYEKNNEDIEQQSKKLGNKLSDIIKNIKK